VSWKYKQSTGEMFFPGGSLLAVGYSGAEGGKNNPDMQGIHNIGPIPQGKYNISLITDASGIAVDYEHKKSPVMHLTPDAENEMFGRAGFLIHGDSVSEPGTASRGCIILSHSERCQIAGSKDKWLEVIA
jgi:hypothetical protein